MGIEDGERLFTLRRGRVDGVGVLRRGNRGEACDTARLRTDRGEGVCSPLRVDRVGVLRRGKRGEGCDTAMLCTGRGEGVCSPLIVLRRVVRLFSCCDDVL